MRKILTGAFAIALLAVVGLFYLARFPAIPADAVGVNFDRALTAKGAELAMLGNCNICHTAAGAPPYAGGRPVVTPFGTVYATNITPDPDTGIGAWTEVAFLRAMQEGVRRDGAHLYPAFPYDHFTRVASEDLRAIYAFLMTRVPVRLANKPNALNFPFSQRPLIAVWKLLYFRRGPLAAASGPSTELERGAYLVHGLAHCGACHTSRNVLGAERRDHDLAGGEAEDWHAPALDAGSTTPVAWTRELLFLYLRHGFVSPHGVAAGPMQAVVNNLAAVPEADVRAIAAYVATRLGPPTADRRPQPGAGVANIAPQPSRASSDAVDGGSIYAGSCALCHEASGQRFSARGIELATSKLITLPDARNLAHVILEGIGAPIASPAAMMPSFAAALTDQQVAALMRFLRATFSDRPPWTDVEAQVAKVRSGVH